MSSASIPDADFKAAAGAQEESLDVEFKRSLDLSSKEGKAKLAKEICALCNFGGGWIGFGRDDNGETVDALPDELSVMAPAIWCGSAMAQSTVRQPKTVALSPSTQRSLNSTSCLARHEAFDLLV